MTSGHRPPEGIGDVAAEIGALLAAARETGAPPPLHDVAEQLGRALDAGCVLFFFSDEGETVWPVGYWHGDPTIRALIGEYVQAVSRVAESRVIPLVRRGETVRLEGASLAGRLSAAAQPFVRRAAVSGMLLVPVRGPGGVVGGVQLTRY